jgi:hypothetical protein
MCRTQHGEDEGVGQQIEAIRIVMRQVGVDAEDVSAIAGDPTEQPGEDPPSASAATPGDGKQRPGGKTGDPKEEFRQAGRGV